MKMFELVEATNYKRWGAQKAYLHAKREIKGRWPEMEDTILSKGDVAERYISSVIKQRDPDFENVLLRQSDLNAASYYAQKILKQRWSELENELKKRVDRDYDNYYALIARNYAIDVIKGRWPEMERYFAKDKGLAVTYMMKLIDGEWPAFKQEILKNRDDWTAILYAEFSKKRFVEAEEFILQANSGMIVRYATGVLERRWPEAEPKLLADKDARDLVTYAREAIRGRWPEAEDIIATDLFIASYYPEVDGQRFKQIEERIIDSEYLGNYLSNLAPDQREQFMLDMVQKNPENIQLFPETSKDVQELALKLGGKRIYLLIKKPHPEIIKMYQGLENVKRTGLFR